MFLFNFILYALWQILLLVFSFTYNAYFITDVRIMLIISLVGTGSSLSGVKRPPFSAEIKNALNSNSTPTYVFMAQSTVGENVFVLLLGYIIVFFAQKS